TSTTYLAMDAGTYVMTPGGAANASGRNTYLPGFGDAGGPGGCDLTGSVLAEWQQDCESGRHLGGVNVLYADGHAKWHTSQTIIRQGQTYSASTHPPNGWDPLPD